MGLCRRSDDFTEDLSDQIRPVLIDISVKLLKFTVYFDLKQTFPAGTTFLLYMNGSVVDRTTYNTKAYSFLLADLKYLTGFAVVPVAPGVDYVGYDPLCDQSDIQEFPIRKDIALASDNYVWGCDPVEAEYKGKSYKNFISVDRQALGIAVNKGTKVRLADGRRRLVNDKFINKISGPARSVLGIRDYRFASRFDKQGWIGDPTVTYPCSFVPARPEVSAVTIAEGTLPINDVDIPGQPPTVIPEFNEEPPKPPTVIEPVQPSTYTSIVPDFNMGERWVNYDGSIGIAGYSYYPDPYSTRYPWNYMHIFGTTSYIYNEEWFWATRVVPGTGDINIGQILVTDFYNEPTPGPNVTFIYSVWRSIISFKIPADIKIKSAKLYFPSDMKRFRFDNWTGGWSTMIYRNDDVYPLEYQDVKDWPLGSYEGQFAVDTLDTGDASVTVDHTTMIPGQRVCYVIASSKDVAQIAPVLDPVREAFRFKRRQEYLDALHAGNQLDTRMIPYNTNEIQGGFRQSRLQLVGYV